MFARIFHWLFGWLSEKPLPKKQQAIDPATAETDILPPVHVPTTLEACAMVLMAVHLDRLDFPDPLGSYEMITNRVWHELPPEVRGANTPVNRAEFASAVRAAVRLHDDVATWMSTPD